MAFWNKDLEDSEKPISTREKVGAPESGPDATHGSEPKPSVQSEIKADSPEKSSSEQTLDERLSKRFGTLRSALGPGTIIQGKLSFDTPVRIDGQLSGEIYSSTAVIVGPTGKVDADIEVASLIVMGKVSGNIKAIERIELFENGELAGEVTTQSLLIEHGAIFQGRCSMGSLGAEKSAGDASSKNLDKSTDIENQKEQAAG